MATEGKVKTNVEYDSYFWVKWEQVGDQDIVNNRTQIKWSCGIDTTHKFYKNAIRMSAFSINGVQVYGGGTYSDFTGQKEQKITSGDLWISHDADGTKTLTISSFTGWLYQDHHYSSSGGSFDLENIPRQAKIIEAPDFSDLTNPSITFSNPGGFPMDVWLEPNPMGDHLFVVENIPTDASSYTWNMRDQDYDELRNRCPVDSRECTVRLGLDTRIGDTTYSDYRDVKFTIKDMKKAAPSVKMEVSLNNGSLTGFDGVYIQGKSKVDVSLSSTGKYNAEIKSYSAEIDGKTYNSQAFTSDVLQRAGNVTIKGYAKDSRGFTGSAEKNITVMAYSKPLVVPLGNNTAILCHRSDDDGNRVGNSTSVWVKAQISYYDLDRRNECVLQYRVKPANEEWNDDDEWEELHIVFFSNTEAKYDSLIPGEVFDTKESYTVQLRAIDTIGEFDIKTFEIPTEDVALHLGRGGKNVAVGTYCTYDKDHTFTSAWDAYFDAEVYIGDKTLRDYIKSVINEGGQ